MDTLRLLTRGSGLKLNGHGQDIPRPLPSAGDNNARDEGFDEGSKKRKREDFEDGVLSEAEIRQNQKQHKIRITDLKSLHDEKKFESRKAQKEGSRIFPQPLRSFSQLKSLDVVNRLMLNIAEQGYKEPTEVQIANIPILLSKHKDPNLLTVAPTGSGKTLAFLIPLINRIGKSHHATDIENVPRHVRAVILAPTKELVRQIVNEGRKLTAGTGVRVSAFQKGMRLHENISASDDKASDEELSEGDEANANTQIVKADILVSTPLSLVHAITPRNEDDPLPLPHIEHLILDEADVLLDPLFRAQTLSIWSACNNTNLRSSLWSATIGSNIEELAIATITAREKSLKIRRPPPLLRTIVGVKDTSLPNISHKLIYASTEPGKLTGLRQLLHPPPPTSKQTETTPALRPPFLVFTQTIDRATALHRELLYDIPPPAPSSSNSPTKEVPSRIAVLHSSLSATQRSNIMQNFRLGKIWILITTDLLSRGVDFRGVNGVVNYDMPTTAASYIHRAGRTGRAGREGGVCVTFYTRDDIKYLKVIANVISASEKNQAGDGNSSGGSSVPAWLLQALPDLTKSDRKDLKTRGVGVRRGMKQSDTAKERRVKAKNRIGTTSGYERQLQNRKKGAIEGSKRRTRKEMTTTDTTKMAQENDQDRDFEGFD